MSIPFTGRRSILAACIAIALCISLPNPSPAQQSNTASITGTVLDVHGNAIENASVVVKSESGHISRSLTTSDQGAYTADNLPAGTYDLTITAAGFALTTKTGIVVAADQSQHVHTTLNIDSLSQSVVVQGIDVNSIAAQHALSQGSLDAVTPKSEISNTFIRDFNPPTADFSDLIQIAPGAFSYNSNGPGLGQGTTYFRGFADGNYDITWDGIPFEDTNSPTHHSWSFFPGVWIGGIEFDRSPGTTSTIGPSTFGGSINLFSGDVPSEQSILPSVSYGSFNTVLASGSYNTGFFGPGKKLALSLNVHRMSSDGFETLNTQLRNAGDIKVLYKLSDKTTITGYSGVIRLNTNTWHASPYRAQVNAYGWNYSLQNNDPTSAFYQKYNFYYIPTDFEYAAVRSTLSHGWFLDVKPYTYSYYNRQYYANDNPKDTTGLATGPNSSTGFINSTTCAPNQAKKDPCAVDKLNSYRKYGETSTISQASHYGIFRAGMWYEWATTNRFQTPSDPLTLADDNLPNFHEKFYTNSYNPFIEYEWHATNKLTIIAGDKYAYYNMSLTQYADNGKTVGNLGGAPFVTSSGGFGSNLPSAEANYRLLNNLSIYGQFGKGSEIPPSSTFDVQGGGQEVTQLPKPTETTTYQGGTVFKMNRITLDADYYWIKFQNNYIPLAVTNPNDPAYDNDEYYLGPDSVTKGFEAEANASLGYGLNAYANGTVGKATYTGSGVPSDLYVADTPEYTQTLGVTYQDHGFDVGAIEKRIGDHYNDNGSYHNQVYVPAFNSVNLSFNYTLSRPRWIFDQSKIGFSVNNLLNDESIMDVGASNKPVAVGSSQYLATTAPSPLDTLSLTSGRSFMVSFKVGIFPNRK